MEKLWFQVAENAIQVADFVEGETKFIFGGANGALELWDMSKRDALI